MKSNNKGQKTNVNNLEQNLQDYQQTNENVSAQKDGFRYDYNDSSDFKDGKMS